MNIADYALKNQVIMIVFTILLLVAGVFAYQHLGRLEDPEFTIKEAKVYTAYPGARPLQVEQEVTDVLETAIQQLPQLKQIKSTSQENLSIITPEIQDSYDKHSLPQVWDELRRKVNDAKSSLPPGAGPSVVYDDFGDVYGVFFAVTGKDYSFRELKEFADILRRELLLIEGVAKVDLWGEQQETIYVEIARSKLAKLGIPLSTIYTTLADQNLIIPAGNVRVGDEYISFNPTGSFDSVEDIKNLFIQNVQGKQIIYLSDIADVYRGYREPPKTLMRFNGLSAIGLGISTAQGGNVVTMGEAVLERLKQLKVDAPIGMDLNVIYYQAGQVTKSIDTFVVSLIEAIVIVIVVLLLFMGFRSGMLIGAMLLLTILGTFVFMYIFHIALERISLGALIIALGMLVDNAIVVTDGILVEAQQGRNLREAASYIVSKTMWPLLGATFVAVSAFAAISASQDATGEYTRSLFQVIFISLMLSWLIAVTITPLFCVYFLKGNTSTEQQHYNPYDGIIFKFYRHLLQSCIQWRWVTIAVMLILLVISIKGFSHLEESFFPDSTQPQFMIDYWRPQGSDINATSDDMKHIEKFVQSLEGVTGVSSFVGSGAMRFILQYSPEDTNSSYGQIIVNVDDYHKIPALITQVESYLNDNFPNAEPKVQMFRMGTGSGAKIAARFSGPDPMVLRQLAEQAKAIMRFDLGTKYVRDDWRQKVKVLQPELSDNKVRRAGITRKEVSNALANASTGLQVGIYRENNKLLPIVSRYPLAERENISEIEDVQIWSPATNTMIPIRQVVNNFKTIWEDGLVKRRDRRLTITAEADPIAGNASVVFERIRNQIEAIPIPSGYSFEWGGEYEDSIDAQAGIAKSLPVIFVLMVLVVIIMFNSIRQPLIIWLSVPLALIGVTAGLLITHQSFGFMALLGFLSLSGMLIKNAIVLIDEIDIQIKEGKQGLLAVLDSSVGRMRPVMMAALTTVLGMIPLLFDAFFISMAVTIMFGLMFASVLTLLVVPVLYTVLFRIQDVTR